MLIIPALEYERLRQDESQWNKIILHREGKFYRSYEWSLWLIKTLVCTEDLQRERGDISTPTNSGGSFLTHLTSTPSVILTMTILFII